MTTLQRWTRGRDLALASTRLLGASHRFLADVFDVDPSRVTRILARLDREMGGITAESIRLAIADLARGK